MDSKMEFDALSQLVDQFERLPATAPSRGRKIRLGSPAVLGAALCIGVVGTASAAKVVSVISDGSEKAEVIRRDFKTPAPAPAGLAASYSALADGKVHAGPPVDGAKVSVHGGPKGACIDVLSDGALGPGGSCFTEADAKATNLWNTIGSILVVLVPDKATDITIKTADGTRRPGTAISNLVVADRSDTVSFAIDGKDIDVASPAQP